MAGLVMMFRKGKVKVYKSPIGMHRIPCGHGSNICLSVRSYFPNGASGVFSGSATLFFAYIGFDAVASTAEEVGLCSVTIEVVVFLCGVNSLLQSLYFSEHYF